MSAQENIYTKPFAQGMINEAGDVYANVKMTGYDLSTDTYEFTAIFGAPDAPAEQIKLTGAEVAAMIAVWEGPACVEVMKPLDWCVIHILYDQDVIESDDPTEFIGQAYTLDV